MSGGHEHRHSWLMLIGCALPLLMIFVLPLLGIRQGWVVPIALAAMLLCHLMTGAVASRGAKGHGEAATGDAHAHH